jgi:hypothetical protein
VAGIPGSPLRCSEWIRANFISVTARADTNIAATVRTDPRALELYREHWAALDPWGNSPRFASAGPSTVVLGHDLISHSALRETAFYRDFGRSYDIARCVAGIVENGQRVSVLAINGTERVDHSKLKTPRCSLD